MKGFALLGCLLVAGCTAPLVDLKASCLPMREYSAVDQASLATEWLTLDPKSLTASQFIPDAIKMRDANRACKKSTQPP